MQNQFNIVPSVSSLNKKKSVLKWLLIICTLILGTGIALGSITIPDSQPFNFGVLLVFLAPIAAVGGSMYLTQEGIKPKKFSKFVADNGWVEGQSDVSVHSVLLDSGSQQSHTYGFHGKYNDLTFDVFTFSHLYNPLYSGSYYANRVVTIRLNRDLPNIYIRRRKKKMQMSMPPASANIVQFLKNPKKLTLEGDFGKLFEVYTLDDYEISALTVLSPDVMLAILNAKTEFDIELFADRIFFYFSDTDFNSSTFQNIFNATNSVMNEIAKSLTTTNIYATTAQEIENQNGRYVQMKTFNYWPVVASICGIIAVAIILFVLSFFD